MLRSNIQTNLIAFLHSDEESNQVIYGGDNGGSSIPANAILDQNGQPILDQNGQPILAQ